MKLIIVVEKPDNHDNWTCIDEKGGTHRVDFSIDGSKEFREKLKWGSIVEVEGLQPYIEIARLPEIVDGRRK